MCTYMYQPRREAQRAESQSFGVTYLMTFFGVMWVGLGHKGSLSPAAPSLTHVREQWREVRG